MKPPNILWIGKLLESESLAASLEFAGYHVHRESDYQQGLQTLRSIRIDLIVLEHEVSCVQGELVAVRLRSAAPRVPVLLLCRPEDPVNQQVLFVNKILSLGDPEETLLNAVTELLPRRIEQTGT
ncbi:MAG TPA: hypothetical protein VE783_12790 [Candidatus Limnocylindrales bacterium]|jgi:PleD family two-component response regulator|nr:hypothetical protein [Candidatus Limnocylindrales bacterium]